MAYTEKLQSLQGVDDSIKARVINWLNLDLDPSSLKELENLIDNDPKGLVDAFYTTLSFGTGGLRAIMGPGTNRMNTHTVSFVTQGLANYLKHCFKDEKISVAIGYDSRNHSAEYALFAARILAGNGIKVFLFKELRPTPLVSFACRYHNCRAGIMITASHNSSEYNGYKVFWLDGSQILPPHDSGIVEEVKKNLNIAFLPLAEPDTPLIVMMGEELDCAYLDAIKSLKLSQDDLNNYKANVRILYSSLHGTGITMVPKALREYGFVDIGYVDSQIIPDGNFPTISSPNPEEREALQLGIEKLVREKYDIFLATDPDGDRLGVVILKCGKEVLLTGNEIACIAVDFICSAMQKEGPFIRKAFMKSIVTTELFRAIVERYGGKCVDVLTGFKYVAEKIRIWEETKEYEYIFGAEESYGYLLGTIVRDKDAIAASCLVAEIAAYCKSQGMTLIDYLHKIYKQYGVYREALLTIKFDETKAGKESQSRALHQLRKSPPNEIASSKVFAISDFIDQSRVIMKTGQKEIIQLPKTDMLLFELENGSRIFIRPSGTEPKVKIYLMVKEVISTIDIEESITAADMRLNVLKKEIEAHFKPK